MPTGYFVTSNATEYEFDVNVYSPTGTVVFEVLLIAENISAFENVSIIAYFAGLSTEYDPYTINGMNREVIFNSPTENPLLIIAVDTTLNANDSKVDYLFRIDYVVLDTSTKTAEVNVTLHEIGKLAQLAILCLLVI